MRGAELSGEPELLVVQIDCDDRLGAGELRPEQAVQTDAAEAYDGDRVTREDPRGVDHRADTGHDRTSEQCGLVQWQVVIDDHDGAAIHDRVLGKARHAGMMCNVLSVQVQALAATQELSVRFRPGGLFADARPPFQAPSAAAAAGAELKDDVIARLDVANAGADFHDLASALMAEDHRQRTRSVAVDDGEIGMAEAAAADLDEHFSRLRRIQL